LAAARAASAYATMATRALTAGCRNRNALRTAPTWCARQRAVVMGAPMHLAWFLSRIPALQGLRHRGTARRWRVVMTNTTALQGPGFFCLESSCKKQCSASGHRCVPADALALYPAAAVCMPHFRSARARSLCVLDADLSGVVQALADDVNRLISRITPGTNFANAPSCIDAVTALACFSTVLACDAPTDVELPLCADACTVYQLECKVRSVPADVDCSAATRSRPCSGASGFNSQSRAKRRTIIGLASLFSIMLFLFVLLWCLCATSTRDALWCFHRRRWRRDELGAIEEVERNGGALPAASSGPRTDPERGLSNSVASPSVSVEGPRGRWPWANVFANPLLHPSRQPRPSGSTAPLLPGTSQDCPMVGLSFAVCQSAMLACIKTMHCDRIGCNGLELVRKASAVDLAKECVL
jgi:hypothetical protein